MAKYNNEIVERITDLIKSDTYTIAEICKMAYIDEATFYRWKSEKKEFCESIKKAQDDRLKFFTAEAKKSLIKKIQGYTVQEKKTVYIDDKDKKPKIKEQTITDKYFQPDTAAIIFTLCNTDPENWKNKQLNEVKGKIKVGKELEDEIYE
jgi:transposase